MQTLERKGAWILQLRRLGKTIPRSGAAAYLQAIGTKVSGSYYEMRAVELIDLVATDDEVYNQYSKSKRCSGDKSFELNARQ